MTADRIIQVLKDLFAEAKGREEWIIKALAIIGFWWLALPNIKKTYFPIDIIFIVTILLPFANKILTKYLY